MDPIKHRIDFVAIVVVNGANPNGDPLGDNWPRTDSVGFGEISDVCIKHKLRNQMEIAFKDGGKDCDEVLVTAAANDRTNTIRRRIEAKDNGKLAEIVFDKKRPNGEKVDALCKAFRDVRTFGSLLAITADKKNDEEGGVSIGVRGPVTIQTAKSVDKIDLVSMQITKCISTSGDGDKTSDTMGMKHCVERAAYTIKGSCNAYLAEKTGFSDEDAEALKEALKNLFFCDESAARPAGTMEVNELFWCESPSKMGSISSGAVFRSFGVTPKDEFPFYNVVVDMNTLNNAGIKVEHWLA